MADGRQSAIGGGRRAAVGGQSAIVNGGWSMGLKSGSIGNGQSASEKCRLARVDWHLKSVEDMSSIGGTSGFESLTYGVRGRRGVIGHLVTIFTKHLTLAVNK